MQATTGIVAGEKSGPFAMDAGSGRMLGSDAMRTRTLAPAGPHHGGPRRVDRLLRGDRECVQPQPARGLDGSGFRFRSAAVVRPLGHFHKYRRSRNEKRTHGTGSAGLRRHAGARRRRPSGRRCPPTLRPERPSPPRAGRIAPVGRGPRRAAAPVGAGMAGSDRLAGGYGEHGGAAACGPGRGGADGRGAMPYLATAILKPARSKGRPANGGEAARCEAAAVSRAGRDSLLSGSGGRRPSGRARRSGSAPAARQPHAAAAAHARPPLVAHRFGRAFGGRSGRAGASVRPAR